MDIVQIKVVQNQIGGPKVYTNYPSLTKTAIGTMMQRIDKPYGTDYPKDEDYVKDVQNGQARNSDSYGTTGKIYTEKKN